MKLTWLGCASYKIDCGDIPFWTDPFISMSSEAENVTTEETFEDAYEILISHGHFDHLMSIPEFNALREIRVHCTETPHDTLLRHGIPEQRMNCCAPGDSFYIGNAKITVYQGRHNVPDLKMTIGAVLRVISSPRNILNFFRMAAVHKQFPEADETVIYEIEHDGRRVLSMGSPGLPENERIPKRGADLLILPYNGMGEPIPSALQIVEELSPRAVLLSHHDNAIPPLTGKMDVEGFVEAMGDLHPEVPVVVPKFGEEMLLTEIMGISKNETKHWGVRIA